ncbi:MAG: DUF4112 domain-containing protein [Hyphomonas sp.]
MADVFEDQSILDLKLENGKTVEEELRHFRVFAKLMDAKFSLFGIRFGLDSILGLIPIAGDISMGVAGIVALISAFRLKLPLSAKIHILWNLGFDTLLGSIPIVGDIFDFFFRSNTKNFKVVEKHLARKIKRQQSN